MTYKVSPLILLSLSLALLVSYAPPVSIKSENNENRTMATFAMVFAPEKGSVAYRESPVERLDAALTDQVAGRQTLVNLYQRLFNASGSLAGKVRDLFGGGTSKECRLRNVGVYAEIAGTGYLTRRPSGNHLDPEMIAAHAKQLERIGREHPDLKEYVYFATQAYDTGWFDTDLGMKTADRGVCAVDAVPDREHVQSFHLLQVLKRSRHKEGRAKIQHRSDARREAAHGTEETDR